MIRLLLIAAASITLAACGGSDAADSVADDSVSNDELRSGGIKSITVNHSSSAFGPRPAPGSCRTHGGWTVDFEAKHLKGDSCTDGRDVVVDRDLTSEEMAKVKDAVAQIQATPRPRVCPRDQGAQSVSVKRGSTEKRYVDARSSCNSDRTPATEASLGVVVQLMHRLGTASNEPDQPAEVALGLLDAPGERLNGETFEVAKGGSLSFEASENQIVCIRDLEIAPSTVASIKEEVTVPRENGLLGGSQTIKRTITVSREASTGAVGHLTSGSCFQARNDPNYNLDFKIKVK